MVERLIRISPNGEEAIFLYDDKIPWKDLGEMKCRRASDVVFDKESQKWAIVPPTGEDFFIGITDRRFETRQDAIDYEIEVMEGFLQKNPYISDLIGG